MRGGAAGEDRELFHPVTGVLTARRVAGGETLTGGLYGEATRQSGRLLLTAGGRLDGWSTFDSHRLERNLITGRPTLDLRAPARGGVLPTARVGARVDVGVATWLRTAAYSGFRAPTLNELYRPFRVGNDVTEANSALVPERLYGVEVGVGGAPGGVTWSATAFYNRLDDPVTNVTLANGPITDPVAGFIPAGGVLLQRRNVGAVDAYGVEAENSTRLSDALTTAVALSWTHARGRRRSRGAAAYRPSPGRDPPPGGDSGRHLAGWAGRLADRRPPLRKPEVRRRSEPAAAGSRGHGGFKGRMAGELAHDTVHRRRQSIRRRGGHGSDSRRCHQLWAAADGVGGDFGIEFSERPLTSARVEWRRRAAFEMPRPFARTRHPEAPALASLGDRRAMEAFY